jgi:hypothetical protein
MYRMLSRAGHKGKIQLPVIFVGQKIYHPSLQIDTALTHVLLPHVIDSLLSLKNKGFLKLSTPTEAISEVSAPIQSKNHDDCEIQNTPNYIILGNFSEINEALSFVNELVTEGYEQADYLHYKGSYRVYSGIFQDQLEADSALQEFRQANRISYLLKVE